MPPYRLVWLQIAERQYLDLPPDVREFMDARRAQRRGRDPATVVVLRLVLVLE
jgi:hypothetical protein